MIIVAGTDIPQFINNIDMEQLISLGRDRPILWNKSLEDYKCKNITNATRKNVCVILYSDFDELICMYVLIIMRKHLRNI